MTVASSEFHELVKKLRSRPREENPTIEQLRAGFAALSRQFPPSASATFEPVDASGVPAEWVSVAAGKPLPVILSFPGGGYLTGSPPPPPHPPHPPPTPPPPPALPLTSPP